MWSKRTGLALLTISVLSLWYVTADKGNNTTLDTGNNTNSDTDNNATDTGNNTTNTGNNTTDTGNNTTDTSNKTTDTGNIPTLQHYNITTDTGNNATNTGNNATDTGNNTTDTGNNATDTGNNSTNTGNNATDTGNNATDTGNNTTDTGNNATPDTGNNKTETGNNTTSDTGNNTTVDTGNNTTPDTGNNTSPDTGNNATDTGNSATPDTGSNTTDTGNNTTPDTGNNTTPDLGNNATDTGNNTTNTSNNTISDTGNKATDTGNNATDTGNNTTDTGNNTTSDTGNNTTSDTGNNATDTGNNSTDTGNNTTPDTDTNTTAETESNTTTSENAISTTSVDRKSTSVPASTVVQTNPFITVSQPRYSAAVPYFITPIITFPFISKYNETFDAALEDPKSELYKNTSERYRIKIEKAFANVTGFQKIIIHNFWNGSVGVNYSAAVEFKVSIETFKRELQEQVVPLILKQDGIETDFVERTFNESIDAVRQILKNTCQRSTGLCKPNYLCMLEDSKTVCRPLCTKPEAISKCENGGTCVQDAPDNFICRCPEDETFLYGGQFCEVKAEKLALKKDYIIAIACGAGGGVILILIIIIIILYRKRGAKKHSHKDNSSEQSFKSIRDSEDGPQQVPIGNRYSALLDYSNPTFRQLEQRTENLRLHSHSSVGGSQAPVASQANVASNYGLSNLSQTRPLGPETEASRPGGSRSLLSLDRTPSRDQPALYPDLQSIHATAEYMEIEDTYSKSTMYQPTRAMRPLPEFQQGRPLHSPTEAKVYDYSSRADLRGNPGHSQLGSRFSDFDYENSTERGSRVDDPYLIRRPQFAAQKRHP